MIFLEHSIKYIDTSPNKSKKVLLIDSYISYITLEFIL
jgi:hypothetical protein